MSGSLFPMLEGPGGGAGVRGQALPVLDYIEGVCSGSMSLVCSWSVPGPCS